MIGLVGSRVLRNKSRKKISGSSRRKRKQSSIIRLFRTPLFIILIFIKLLSFRPIAALFITVILAILSYKLATGGYISRIQNGVYSFYKNITVSLGFKLDKVTISGVDPHNSEQLIDFLQLYDGRPMADIDINDLHLKLLSIDWVKDVEILRKLPNQIKIKIYRRIPYAIWQNNKTMRLVDIYGGIIEKLPVSRYKHLPIVVGKGGNLKINSLLNYLEVYPDLKLRLKAAVRVADRRWNLYLNDGMKILLPEFNVENSIFRLRRIDEKYQLIDRKVKLIDLRFDGKIIIRPLKD